MECCGVPTFDIGMLRGSVENLQGCKVENILGVGRLERTQEYKSDTKYTLFYSTVTL